MFFLLVLIGLVTCFISKFKITVDKGEFFFYILAFDASSNVWLSRWTEMPQHEKKEPRNLYIYCAIVGGSAILQFIRAFAVFHAALQSSENLHNRYGSCECC